MIIINNILHVNFGLIKLLVIILRITNRFSINNNTNKTGKIITSNGESININNDIKNIGNSIIDHILIIAEFHCGVDKYSQNLSHLYSFNWIVYSQNEYL